MFHTTDTQQDAGAAMEEQGDQQDRQTIEEDKAFRPIPPPVRKRWIDRHKTLVFLGMLGALGALGLLLRHTAESQRKTDGERKPDGGRVFR